METHKKKKKLSFYDGVNRKRMGNENVNIALPQYKRQLKNLTKRKSHTHTISTNGTCEHTDDDDDEDDDGKCDIV